MRKVLITLVSFAGMLCAETVTPTEAPVPSAPTEKVPAECVTLCAPCKEYLNAQQLTPENTQIFCRLTKAQRTQIIHMTNQEGVEGNEAVRRVAEEAQKAAPVAPKGCPVK